MDGMMPLKPVSLALILCIGGFAMQGEESRDIHASPLVAKPRVTKQTYCSGDADLFSVSIELSIEFKNTSRAVVELLWPIVPMEGKVASSPDEARRGHFLFKQSASHYPQDPIHFQALRFPPGKEHIVKSGYYLLARHNATFSQANTLPPGTYSVVLVLAPEEEPPIGMLSGGAALTKIETQPFPVTIPRDPKLTSCDRAVRE